METVVGAPVNGIVWFSLPTVPPTVTTAFFTSTNRSSFNPLPDPVVLIVAVFRPVPELTTETITRGRGEHSDGVGATVAVAVAVGDGGGASTLRMAWTVGYQAAASLPYPL